MQYIIVGIAMMLFGFVWMLCAASKQDIGVDECEEQEKWLREYEERRRQKLEKRRRRR